ncbi:N-methyltryptophan oxidase [Aureimonas sp. SA4125]|uniref:N-methyl-L-tryptophan oxidase n=1 Tax=Aureimonas sp. SA4125 TaxID=2826993 RepID=UPI001CC551EA|nr:N-methyl-L-tryptophan oxidase [Aureimonas sp. SA4125]BDA85262.1 N-methyltryptophan oxidase [Aureimonas sp. SA4125]
MSDFDVAVIGLGAMGSAAVAHLAERGVRVIGFEAAFPAHALGSSHGDTRLIRLGYFEDPAYVPLLHRAYANWRALEAASGADILTVSGILQIGRPESGIVAGTIASCTLHGLSHEVLDAAASAVRFPAVRLEPDEVAVLEPQGGFLRPETAVMAHLRVATGAGAMLRLGEKVTAIEPDDAGVTLVSDHSRVRARKVIVATGPWIADLVPALAGIARPIRQVVAWYTPRDGVSATLGPMLPFLLDEAEGGSFFGVPALGPDGLKVGKHAHFMEPVDPDQSNPPVNEADLAMLDDFVARRIPVAVGQRRAAITCRYTMLPGEDFLLDHLPGEPRIVVASPCSGHGFKFASVVGEILADLAMNGGTSLPIDAFSFAALAGKKG